MSYLWRELGEDCARGDCKISGKFRGAADVSCNLDCQIPKFVPAIFHNLSGYDSHLFIKKLKGNCEDKNKKIKCIPQNEENYIAFSREVVLDSFVKDGKNVLVKRDLRFIDSF